MKSILLGALFFLSAISARAELHWMLVTDSGTQIPVAQVQCLVAADDAKTFSVLPKGTEWDAITGVKSVSFTQSSISGIQTVASSSFSAIPDMVSKSVLVMGAEGQNATIYATDGKTMFSTSISSQSERIDVSELPAGAYILAIGKASVKFIKK